MRTSKDRTFSQCSVHSVLFVQILVYFSLFPYRKSTLLLPLLKTTSPQKTVGVERLRQLLTGPLRAQSLPSTLRFRTTRIVMLVGMAEAYSAVTNVPARFISSAGEYV